MEVNLGFKQTEVGAIPDDWQLRTLVSLTDPVRTPRYGIVQPGEHAASGILMLRSQDYSKGWVDATTMHRASTSLATQYQNARLKAGDLVMTIVGANTGQVVEIPRWLDGGVLSRSTARIAIDRDNADNRFIRFFLESRPAQRQVRDHLKEGAQPVLSCADLSKFQIPLPPTKAEQEAIAEALSDADALIESLEQLLAKNRHLKQGVMQELLTGTKPLPGFSGEWGVKVLGTLFDFSGGFTASRDQLSSDGYCYLHYGDIHTSKKNFVDVRAEYQDIPKLDIPLKKVSSASLLEDGDIVFVDASEDDEGTSKHVVIVNRDKIPFISGLHTIVAKSKTGDLDHLYRRYCLQTTAIKRQFYFFAVGTKVSGISKTNIAKVILPLPSIPEQIAIATILSDMDTEIAALEARLAKTRQLRLGMMQELLTGRIRLL
jgi:type I restriction enzyme, S subunit